MGGDEVSVHVWRPLLGLALTSLVVMGSPGPSTMSITAVAAAFGPRRALAYLAGLVLGTTTVLLAVAGGLVSVLLSVPALAPILIGASAAYMIYLAWKIGTAPPLARRDGAARPPSLGEGLALAIANPKAYAAIAAVFAGSTLGMRSPFAEAAAKTAALAAMIVVIHLGWMLAGASFARLLGRPRIGRGANIAFAAILVAATVAALVR